ncbi:o-succinylbenzoate synthase [Tenuibacillus multivorans]|uniref:o-succinylbenzoate synthase n=1 Tax=Tenuibacillus multivorans TaxID=237069 RepID=A0A1H0FQR1_9BACI|nr:o-succinylbenzoate synthase [Tenuibacillus multivorans]GEL77923.1 o-succinylbenzoate synthase [Tenuibacillus multivorans]SDN96977.1 O-succinylbenzoate synthase [Tenuibacillus multivorans]
MIHLDRVNVRHVSMKLKRPFQTVNGLVVVRDTLIIEAFDTDGRIGYGECVAFSDPFYSPETTTTAWDQLQNFLLPMLNKKRIEHPSEISSIFSAIQGHPMAKAGIETAIWDLYAKLQDQSLKETLGGVRDEVESGVVLSLTDDIEKQVEEYNKKGYKRYKLKVQKGKERDIINQAKEVVGDTPIMFDGNGMYDPEDMLHLSKLDDLNLFMIEQPFRTDDYYYHHQLKEQINTPISLDETIKSEHDAFQAMELRACDNINVKIGRVGGLQQALNIHRFAKVANMPLWCGGMLETGIGRAHNVALASLEQFTLPGDLSESSRYWEEDIIKEPFVVKDGLVNVPDGPGIGVTVNVKLLNQRTIRQFNYKFNKL